MNLGEFGETVVSEDIVKIVHLLLHNAEVPCVMLTPGEDNRTVIYSSVANWREILLEALEGETEE